MTTAASIPINTYQDILDALERDPALREETRRHFLGEEYLRLPEIVADLAAMVKQVSDVVGTMAEGQARAETDIAELKNGQARTQADIAELKDGQARMEERQTRTEADIADLKESQARTQADIAELKNGQARMEERQTRTQADIAELKNGQARMEERQTRTEADVSELKDTQATLITEVASLRATVNRLDSAVETMGNTVNRLDNTVDSMRGTLNRLDGTDYERTAARRIRRSGGRRLGLTRPVIVQARTLPENDIIPSLLDDAVDDGRITEEQADEIDLVDIIVRGNDPDGILTYAAAEVSLTIEIHDVTRAHDRARLLALATRAPVKAAVIGTAITDDAQDAALSHDVTCIVLPQ